MSAPDTIVLIHGFWVTPRSWEDWVKYYEAKGFNVIAPAYPGLEVEALNADPTPIAELTVPKILDHLESVVAPLDNPIIMGHSAGGLLTQILLDRGYGASAVALNSAPPEGVMVHPWSQLKSTFPVLKNPANRHRAPAFTFEQWNYAFTNGVDEATARATYERYCVPVNGGILFGSVTADVIPGKQDTYVNFKNDDRAPLLFISGSADHIMPPSVQKSNAKHYKSDKTLTEVVEFEGPHFMPGLEGWEKLADHALEWALAHARPSAKVEA